MLTHPYFLPLRVARLLQRIVRRFPAVILPNFPKPSAMTEHRTGGASRPTDAADEKCPSERMPGSGPRRLFTLVTARSLSFLLLGTSYGPRILAHSTCPTRLLRGLRPWLDPSASVGEPYSIVRIIR